MRSSGRMRAQIGTLVIATSIVQLANGFFGTFVSLRVAIESFDVPRSRAQRLFRRLHPGRVSLRKDHRTDRSHSRLRRICRLGRRRHCASCRSSSDRSPG